MLSRLTSKITSRAASTLVVAEHNANTLSPSTLSSIAAANKINGDVSILLASDSTENALKVCKNIPKISKIIVAESPTLKGQLAENIAPIVETVSKQISATHILAPATAFGKNLLPRVAAKLDVNAISDIISVEDENTFTRTIYAGNAIQKVESSDPIKVITVRASAFDDVTLSTGSATEEKAQVSEANTQIEFIKSEIIKSDRPELTAASIVISGGRGMKNGENFQLLYDFADKCGAAVGASRAAVDAGFVPNDLQVGQTGKIVAPELYIAVGISGAIQHLAGMKDSKVIVAINKDEEAPIFQVSDYGLVADLFKVMPEINDKM